MARLLFGIAVLFFVVGCTSSETAQATTRVRNEADKIGQLQNLTILQASDRIWAVSSCSFVERRISATIGQMNTLDEYTPAITALGWELTRDYKTEILFEKPGPMRLALMAEDEQIETEHKVKNHSFDGKRPIYIRITFHLGSC